MSHESISCRKFTMLPWVVYFCGILFYGFAYLLRVYTGVLQPQLLDSLHITSYGFGILTSFYYFAYAPMQIPVGICIDRVGPRLSLLFACTIAVLGAWLFAESNFLKEALVGRFLIGLGSAFAYVTALKICTLWLPKRYFATATGVVTAMGMVAAIVTDNLLTRSIQHMSFHESLMLPVYVGCVVLLVIVLFVPSQSRQARFQANQPSAPPSISQTLTFKQLGVYLSEIASHPQIWLIGIVGAFLYLPSSVFLDTWALPYLEAAHHLSPVQAAYAASLMFAGWILSGASAGFVSDIICNRRKILFVASCSSCVLSSILLAMPGLVVSEIYVLMFLLGVCCGPHHLCFTLSKENFNVVVAGTAISFANFLIMMGGFIFQPVVGKFLDLMRHGVTRHGHAFYSVWDYQMALLVMPLGLFLAMILLFFIKDTYQADLS